MIKCRECFFNMSEDEIKAFSKDELKEILIDHYNDKHVRKITTEERIKINFERIEPGQSEGNPCIL